MCNLYPITTNQEAIRALFRVTPLCRNLAANCPACSGLSGAGCAQRRPKASSS